MADYESTPTVFRLPKSHWRKDLNNFDFTVPGAQEAVRRFIEGERRGLLVTGPPGVGKTHLSVGLYRWAVAQEGTQRSMWTDFPEFVLEVKRGYGTGIDVLEEVREARFFLCLDDFLGRELTSHEMENILYPCIQLAHRNQVRFVLTTNYSLEKISTILTPHELDRVLDNCTHLEIAGESRRG